MLYDELVLKYVVGNDPAAVFDDGGVGGAKYGIYGLTSDGGEVESFLRFSCECSAPALANYAKILAQYKTDSEDFRRTWNELGTIDPDGMAELQDAYAQEAYYERAATFLQEENYDVDSKSDSMKAVLFALAIQYSPANISELYLEACQRIGYNSLSCVNRRYFDKDMILAIYGFLIDECGKAKIAGGAYHSPKGWVNEKSGSPGCLKTCFSGERRDALAMLMEEQWSGDDSF